MVPIYFIPIIKYFIEKMTHVSFNSGLSMVWKARKLDFAEGLPSQAIEHLLNRMLQKEFKAGSAHSGSLQKVTGPLILLLAFDIRATLRH